MRKLNFIVLGMICILFILLLGSCSSQEPESFATKDTTTFRFEVTYAPSDKQWIFLSDENGNTSKAYQIIVGTEIAIPVDGLGDEYMINFFKCLSTTYYAYSFANAKPGTYKLLAPGSQQSSPIHHAYIKIAHQPWDNIAQVYGANVTGSTSDVYGPFTSPQDTVYCDAYFYGDKTDITYYTVKNDTTWRCLKFKDVTPGQVIKKNYGDMVEFDDSVEYTFDQPTLTSCTAWGINGNDLSNYTQLPTALVRWEVNALTYHYPSDKFDEYLTDVGGLYDGYVTDYYTLIDDHVASTFKKWTGEILKSTVQDRKLEVALSENADLIRISRYTRDNAGNYWNWTISMPGDASQSVYLPLLPDSLAKVYPAWAEQQLKFHQVNVTRMIGAEAREGYYNYIGNLFQFKTQQEAAAGYLYSPYKEVLDHGESIDSEGGRKRPSMSIQPMPHTAYDMQVRWLNR